ncbi:c-type cytochrome biogenesis protein CcsB [Nocardioides ganghwensis]|uniref:C-type cytochrome biogenesis protein CcsB n=1 Tax=Nocardioides ganghwensis TaxID=252230 RepID=A0A4Q2SFB1_9ACTN|nr:c-type cytochrome biogenesis protein CcsB [Nocardioides ganghwensis]MBD3945553.1 c-type cytochrome biogenesis protein CcsB [Nocardioides ganghwensis]RYC02232.1 c-type cytochrome biogenesis protein CcsB [Nocardioides ganghwensis]
MTDAQWEVLSYEGVIAAAVLYFIAMLAYFFEMASLRSAAKEEQQEQEVAVGAEMVLVATRRTAVAGRLGLVLTSFAAVVHLVALVARGLAADPNRVPWGNMYEFTISGTFVVALIFVLSTLRLDIEWLGPLVTTFVVAALMAAFLGLDDAVLPLPDALNSPWLVIHVVSAVISTGAFTVGALLSGLYLAKARSTSTTGYLARVPDLKVLDRLSYKMHAFGFPVWTFAVLITGPIWAHQAWGAYWNWDPKEVWAFITWVVYAAYLHARATAGWRGRNAAMLALVGAATLWFNFIGINFFSSSSQHSYAEGVAPETSVVVGLAGPVKAAEEVGVVVGSDDARA